MYEQLFWARGGIPVSVKSGSFTCGMKLSVCLHPVCSIICLLYPDASSSFVCVYYIKVAQLFVVRLKDNSAETCIWCHHDDVLVLIRILS